MTRVFVDTSAWFEFFMRDAPRHAAAVRVIGEHQGGLVTTTHVAAELATLMLVRAGHEAAARIGESLRRSPDVHLVHPDAAEEAEGWRLFLARSDKTYSPVDCLSFTVMRRMGIELAVALDDHFRQEGFRVVP